MKSNGVVTVVVSIYYSSSSTGYITARQMAWPSSLYPIYSLAAFICPRWWIDLFTYTWIQLLIFVFTHSPCFGTGGSVFEDWAQQDFLVERLEIMVLFMWASLLCKQFLCELGMKLRTFGWQGGVGAFLLKPNQSLLSFGALLSFSETASPLHEIKL